MDDLQLEWWPKRGKFKITNRGATKIQATDTAKLSNTLKQLHEDHSTA